MTLHRYILLTILPILLISCRESEDLSSFYFPLSELKEGLVYEYVSVAEPSLPSEFWYYKSHFSGETWWLTGKMYSKSGQIEQRIIERKHKLGILQDSLIIYSLDQDSFAVAVPAIVGPGSVFPFYRNRKDTLVYKVVWVDIRDSMEYIIRRKKCFIGDTVWVIEGNSLPALIFEIDEEVETFRPDIGMTKSGWGGKEIYAQGIGLVFYQKNISSEYSKEYQLKVRYSLDSFLKHTTKF